MLALWLAAYGAAASYGRYSYDYDFVLGTDAAACTDAAAAAECKYCDLDGVMTDLHCSEIADDGECDASCNSANCSWDGMDCFHDDK
jgi:hypothetical protein